MEPRLVLEHTTFNSNPRAKQRAFPAARERHNTLARLWENPGNAAICSTLSVRHAARKRKVDQCRRSRAPERGPPVKDVSQVGSLYRLIGVTGAGGAPSASLAVSRQTFPAEEWLVRDFSLASGD